MDKIFKLIGYIYSLFVSDVLHKRNKLVHRRLVFFAFHSILFVCLRLNVPVNTFSVMSGRSQCLLGLNSTVGG